MTVYDSISRPLPPHSPPPEKVHDGKELKEESDVNVNRLFWDQCWSSECDVKQHSSFESYLKRATNDNGISIDAVHVICVVSRCGRCDQSLWPVTSELQSMRCVRTCMVSCGCCC